tara:strand:- start:399 stop:710 length:312 start_codon:yes stop_codon:yes gene_type:complete
MEEVTQSMDQMMESPSTEESQQIQILYLTNKLILLSEIEEVGAIDIGQPDCKLTNPCLYDHGELKLWLKDITDDNIIMMSSDKILTMVDPNQKLLSQYISLTK